MAENPINDDYRLSKTYFPNKETTFLGNTSINNMMVGKFSLMEIKT